MTASQGPSVDSASRVRARWRVAAPPAEGPLAVNLPAKLRPPQVRVHLVERRALLDTLGQSAAPLVVLCAPAGAGKTTVLRQWAEADARPFAWVQLDEADSDPVVLLTYLSLALESITEVDPSVKSSLALAVPPVQERILPLLGEALAAAPGFVLVLDDAHVLAGEKAWEAVAFVLRNLPDGAQLAIGSRNDPDLPLARMRAAGDVAEFRAAELSLGRSEVAELMRLHECEADDETVDAVYAATEGWATGLQLACLAHAGRPPAEWVPEIRGSRREIAEYLTSEVLDAQPQDVQAFLLRTSVLQELTPRLCALVAGSDEGGELLARVAREELFVVPLGDDGAHYRYHHLFAEMLQGELEKRHPGLADELHRSVAAWYAGEDMPDATVHHLLAAGEAAAAGDVVAAAWPAMWSRGQVETVRRWLGAFTDRQILNHPALTLTAGWVYTALDAGRLGERWCEAACASPHGRLAFAGRRRLTALVAGAAPRHGRRGRRAAHARGRGAGGAARGHAGHQLVRGRAGGARRGPLALGGDPAGPASARRRRARGLCLQPVRRARGARVPRAHLGG